MNLNTPLWGRSPAAQPNRPFQEVWYLKMNQADQGRALWLRFTILSSNNGFKRVAETWAVFFQRKDREVNRVALKQTHDIGAFSWSENDGVKIGECRLSDSRTTGTIASKGKTVSWDLAIRPEAAVTFNAVPEALARAGIVKNTIFTVGEDLRFTGSCTVDGETFTFNDAPGMQGHLAGPKNGHSWVWGHCNAFLNENGRPTEFVFEGLTARSQLPGGIASPKMSAFYFRYQGQDYFFNTVKDALTIRSRNTLTDWNFQADRGELSFRGHAKAEHKDFAGLTYEDTNGSLLYCGNSKLSDLRILVYRRGKLEATFDAQGTAAFEVVSRHKNPYVPMMV